VFVCNLFKNVESSSDYTVSNVHMLVNSEVEYAFRTSQKFFLKEGGKRQKIRCHEEKITASTTSNNFLGFIS